MSAKPELAGRLMAARRALGMTRAAAAEAFGIPASSLRNYETAAQSPGAEALAALLRHGISVDWLLSGAGEMLVARTEALAVREPSAEYVAPGRGAIDLRVLAEAIDIADAHFTATPVPAASARRRAELAAAAYDLLQAGGSRDQIHRLLASRD